MLLTPTNDQAPEDEVIELSDNVVKATLDDVVGVGALATATAGGPGCLNLTKNHSGLSGSMLTATSSERRTPHSSSRWIDQVPAWMPPGGSNLTLLLLVTSPGAE